MAKVNRREIEIVARAMERRYHKDGGPCAEQDGGPDNCWRSMEGFAKAAIVALRSVRRQRKEK